MSDQNVLVLFYDIKDALRTITINNEGRIVDETERNVGRDVFKTTLGAEIVRGFQHGGIKYHVRIASPSHEPWLVKQIFNRHRENDGIKYDGIVAVAGLSCTSDMPRMLMDELYNNEYVQADSVDWDEKTKMKSKYFGQARPVPIIGVPTKDSHTNGHRAFFSMIEVSSPRDAVCVSVEHGYAAAQLMKHLLSNQWNNVRIIVPSTSSGIGYRIGLELKKELDDWFKPFESCKVEFGLTSYSDFVRGPKRDDLSDWKSPPNILPVCIYEDLSELRRINTMAECVIGVSALERKLRDEEFVKEITGLGRVLHARSYNGVNPANFVVQCLSMHPYLVGEKGHEKEVWLNADSLRTRRTEKSRDNVEGYRRK